MRSTAWLMLASGAVLCAQDLKFSVRHDHLRNSGEGTVTFSAAGISFEETAGNQGHLRQWKYGDIERLELSLERIRITTSEDVRWQLNRDRDYVFTHLPKDMAAQLYPFLAARLDERFIARFADASVSPLWAAEVKLLRGGGIGGKLKIGADRIVFDSVKPADSRTWRYLDIQLVAREDPFHLSITSVDGTTRFQLKEALSKDRYNLLWRGVAKSSGMRPVHSSVEIHHE